MATVIIINRSQMGAGDEVLGRKILASGLRKLTAFDDLAAIVLYNAGVKLAIEGSPVAAELHQLLSAGRRDARLWHLRRALQPG